MQGWPSTLILAPKVCFGYIFSFILISEGFGGTERAEG